MRTVVDINIIVRMIIKADGVVAELFYSLKNKNEIYASSASLEEINKHKRRLIRASKLSRADFEELYTKVISHISIVPLSIIPTSFFFRAIRFKASVDYDDIPFVTTTFFHNGFLWTSNRPLFTGLKKKGMLNVLNNNDIKELLK